MEFVTHSREETAALGGRLADALKTGQLSIRSGVCMASSDGFRIRLHGKGGHGAAPEESVSPVYAGIKLIGVFEDIARYELNPQQPSVVNICAIHTGSTYNIIPNDCEIMGTVRTFNEQQRAWLLDRLQQAMNQVASLYRCTAEWHIGQSAPSTHSDEQFSARLHQLLERDLPEIDLLRAGMALAASVITLIPAVFVFFMGQDYLEQGITASGLTM